MHQLNRPHTGDKLNKPIDHFAMLNQHEHLSDIGMEGENISQKITTQPHHIHKDQPGEMKQSVSSQK